MSRVLHASSKPDEKVDIGAECAKIRKAALQYKEKHPELFDPKTRVGRANQEEPNAPLPYRHWAEALDKMRNQAKSQEDILLVRSTANKLRVEMSEATGGNKKSWNAPPHFTKQKVRRAMQAMVAKQRPDSWTALNLNRLDRAAGVTPKVRATLEGKKPRVSKKRVADLTTELNAKASANKLLSPSARKVNGVKARAQAIKEARQRHANTKADVKTNKATAKEMAKPAKVINRIPDAELRPFPKEKQTGKKPTPKKAPVTRPPLRKPRKKPVNGEFGFCKTPACKKEPLRPTSNPEQVHCWICGTNYPSPVTATQ